MKKLMKNKLVFGLICALAAALILFAAAMLYVNSLDKAYDSTQKDTVNIVVEQGATTGDIGEVLEKNKLIKSASSFKLFSKIKGYDGKYQAGAYALSPSMKLSEIADIIINGKTNTITFTIPEGYTIAQISEKLSDEGIVDKDKFDRLLAEGDFDYDFLKGAQSGKNRLEGYLFPDTYTVSFDADEKTIIKAMLDQFDSIFTDDFKAQAKKSGRSVNEIMVIASIVERECQVGSERATISSVIYNRLKEGMPLQMDSTVQYVLGKQKEQLSYSDTEINSPYNTYTNTGLPPGPIGCPGADAVKAALNPEKTDYLYFVVSKKLNGSHVFTKDYDQFLKDKDEYYEALEKQK